MKKAKKPVRKAARKAAASKTARSKPAKKSTAAKKVEYATHPKGLLLSGGPGTGKTFLASCIAAEAKLPFVYLDASSLQGAFVGTSQLEIVYDYESVNGRPVTTAAMRVEPARIAAR